MFPFGAAKSLLHQALNLANGCIPSKCSIFPQECRFKWIILQSGTKSDRHSRNGLTAIAMAAAAHKIIVKYHKQVYWIKIQKVSETSPSQGQQGLIYRSYDI